MYGQKVQSEIEENKKVEDELNTELKILREQLTKLEKDFDSNKSKITDKIKELEFHLNEIKVEEEKMKKHYNQLKEKSKKNMNTKIKNSKRNYPNQVLNASRHLNLSKTLPDSYMRYSAPARTNEPPSKPKTKKYNGPKPRRVRVKKT